MLISNLLELLTEMFSYIKPTISSKKSRNVSNIHNLKMNKRLVFPKKKNEKMRFCGDYRKLNAVTKKDTYPLPLINEIIDHLNGAKWFTSIGLASGY